MGYFIHVLVFEDSITYNFVKECLAEIELKESFLELGPGKNLGALKAIDDFYSTKELNYTYSAVDRDIKPEWEIIARNRGYKINKVIEADMPPIPFDDEEFDVVFSIFFGKTYCLFPEDMLAELSRITKPGGYFFLYEINPCSLQMIDKYMSEHSFDLFKKLGEHKFILKKRQ
jgi:SAM-dependent methyltransferase